MISTTPKRDRVTAKDGITCQNEKCKHPAKFRVRVGQDEFLYCGIHARKHADTRVAIPGVKLSQSAKPGNDVTCGGGSTEVKIPDGLTQEERSLLLRARGCGEYIFDYIEIEEFKHILPGPYPSFRERPKELQKEYISTAFDRKLRGQAKLFYTEIYFLNKYTMPSKRYTVVYIGAAPGVHFPLIARKYPNCKFHLYDQNDFAFRHERNVIIHKQLFYPEDAYAFAGTKNLLFISDIRSNHAVDGEKLLSRLGSVDPAVHDFLLQPDTSGEVSERNVIFDQQLQLEAWRIMNPIAAMLKFRRPFINTPILRSIPVWYSYAAGSRMIQPYAPSFSSETRLIATNPNTSYSYTEENHDSVMFAHNLVRAFTKVREQSWDEIAEKKISPDLIYTGQRVSKKNYNAAQTTTKIK